MSVPPRRRSAPSIARLIDALASPDAQPRESAAARLTIVGLPAAPFLRQLVQDENASPTARATALRVLGGIPGAGGAAAAAAVLSNPVDSLAAEGIEVLRAALQPVAGHDDSTVALEHLTQLALSPAAAVERRIAAVDALQILPPDLREPIFLVLSNDGHPALNARARLAAAGLSAVPDLADVLAGGHLPDAPIALASAVTAAGANLPAADLRRLVDMVRARELSEGTFGHDDKRGAWTIVRGLLHYTLAKRGSHVALADLRDTVRRREDMLSADFLAAMELLADESFLDAVAERWVGTDDGDRWLREQIERVFRSIIVRGKLTRANQSLVQLLARLPAAATLVAMAPKKISRRKPDAGRAN